jgi:hypothetical protein
MPHAQRTQVSPEKSQAEIHRTLMRYGAEAFGVYTARDYLQVCFEYQTLKISITVTIPSPDDQQFRRTPGGKRIRNERQRQEAWEQAVRTRWRALLLSIKAKLEAVECGISTIEHEFMPFVVCADGRTVGDKLLPALKASIASGTTLALPDLRSRTG